GEVYRRLPSKLSARLRAVADEMLHLGRPNQARVEPNVLAPIEARVTEGDLYEIADGVADAGRDYVVVSSFLLEHEPHRHHVIAGKAPVAMRIEIAERQRVGEP